MIKIAITGPQKHRKYRASEKFLADNGIRPPPNNNTNTIYI